MEGSVDQLSSRHSKYGLHNGQQAAAEEDSLPSQNGAAEGEGAEEGRKHMSAHERRLQKKKVLLRMLWLEQCILGFLPVIFLMLFLYVLLDLAVHL